MHVVFLTAVIVERGIAADAGPKTEFARWKKANKASSASTHSACRSDPGWFSQINFHESPQKHEIKVFARETNPLYGIAPEKALRRCCCDTLTSIYR